jgi:hypothetical protein
MTAAEQRKAEIEQLAAMVATQAKRIILQPSNADDRALAIELTPYIERESIAQHVARCATAAAKIAAYRRRICRQITVAECQPGRN